MSKETIVILKNAKHDRHSYLKISDNKVIFDDSDGEYGPTTFSLEVLEKAIKEHKEQLDGS
jgi:hypothetical protein